MLLVSESEDDRPDPPRQRGGDHAEDWPPDGSQDDASRDAILRDSDQADQHEDATNGGQAIHDHLKARAGVIASMPLLSAHQRPAMSLRHGCITVGADLKVLLGGRLEWLTTLWLSHSMGAMANRVSD